MFSVLRRRLADADFWERHENPASGWSRVPTGPLLLYAVYARNWRLLGATAAFVALNPVLFPEPGPEADASWMTRGVRGERLWVQGADAGRAGLLNAVNVPVFLWAVYAAVRRRPAQTAVFTALTMALKLAFVDRMAKLYDREAGRETPAAER
ncbi:hypothetical protein M0R89_04815 [Halorussus limi]|uniref:Uncharacterized protein n=1 Tax=Halorussus limi TaxID=2938695 RepID=A0A8U0HWD0_9EURY|nr:DUF6653 family protein [Halorussus limi]UPV75390.1 hypothetical protein M0R89_04815 [Halorussus limi]